MPFIRAAAPRLIQGGPSIEHYLQGAGGVAPHRHRSRIDVTRREAASQRSERQLEAGHAHRVAGDRDGGDKRPL